MSFSYRVKLRAAEMQNDLGVLAAYYNVPKSQASTLHEEAAFSNEAKVKEVPLSTVDTLPSDKANDLA
jgi:hypothetical protein